MPSLQSVKGINWSDKVSRIIEQIKSLYRIGSDILDLINDVKGIIDKEGLSHNHFGDYQKLSIGYRKCFNGGEDNRKYRLKDQNYKNIKMHQDLLNLADKYVAHSELLDEFDKIDLALVIDNTSNKAIRLRVLHDFYEPLSCKDFPEILKLLQAIHKDVSAKIIELEAFLIKEYNQSIK